MNKTRVSWDNVIEDKIISNQKTIDVCSQEHMSAIVETLNKNKDNLSHKR